MPVLYTTSPNMNLIVPTVGAELGPTWAQDLNYNFQYLIDQHDHTIGHGVQITPSGLNINSDLTMQGNNLLFLKSGSFISQSSLLTSLTSMYVSGGNLFFNDSFGNQIQITASGTVNVAAGAIPGLTSPASLTYSVPSSTFIFQSNVSTSAILDVGPIIVRNLTSGSAGITLQAPTPLTSGYNITLPASVPSVQSFMTLDGAGLIAAPWTVDSNTIVVGPSGSVPANQVGVKDGGITTTQIATNTITNSNLAVMPANTIKGNNTVSPATPIDLTTAQVVSMLSIQSIPNVAVFTSNGTWTVPAGVTRCKVIVTGGGGGSVLGGSSTPAGGGGAGGTAIKYISGLTPGTGISVTIGAGGAASNTGTGGTSSFGSYASATGGSNGTGSAGGIGTGGDINIRGGAGGIGYYDPTLGYWHNIGTGGASYWGNGPRDSYPGAYGGGANCYGANTSGASGVVVIEY